MANADPTASSSTPAPAPTASPRPAPSIRSTYRVQLRPDFTFDDAAAIADYLALLGISHLYSSPQLQASKGSTHGYDIVDHSRLNAELGGKDGHERLQAVLGAAGLGMVLDLVPNHMAITGPENRWWWDVLENGPSSRYASFFDVEWDPPESYLRNKVLLPVLGDHYGRVLENGELQLVRDGAWFAIGYHDQSFPVAPRSVDGVLRQAAERSGSDELAFVADAISRLPPATATDRAAAWRRARDLDVLRGLAKRLLEERPAVAEALDRVIEEINRTPDALDAILEAQNYRLALWRAARRDLGYRRFFGVNSLVGLRQEDEMVFHDTHRLLFRLVGQGSIDGLRIDHPDGLRDPAVYLHRLRENAAGAWVVVEKILEPGEELREDWDVDGTTGYDFLNQVGGLFVDPAGEHAFTELYAELTGRRVDFHEEVRLKKELVLNEELGSDFNRLTQLFLDVAERHRRHRDYTRDELHGALRAAIACTPVYRTYVQAETGAVGRDDERYVREALAAARERRSDLDPGLFDFLESILLLQTTGTLETELVMRFQQLTGPAMAKGAEDTAFYTYNRLVALNEVGGDPSRFGVSPFEFHAFAQRRAERWPRTMNSTSTHDTKRGEDVRTRIAALSEIPEAWASTVRRWRAMNEQYRTATAGLTGAPDADTEYLLYQTLVGTWPISGDRLAAYLRKAMREAKVATSWAAPDEAYETGVQAFATSILADEHFCHELETLLRPIIHAGRLSSLSQLLIRLTAPGIPDTYQGTETWDLTLVDPDNRRPVDYEARRALLASVAEAGPSEVMDRMDEGAPKAWLLHRALRLRNEHPELFGPGADYQPLEAQGPRSTNVFAYLRGGRAVIVAPRLTLGLGDPPDWRSTRLALPAGTWRDVLSGRVGVSGVVELATLLREFPVALLVPDET